MNTAIKGGLGISLAFLAVAIFVPTPANAATCVPTQDVSYGMYGSDVRCVQDRLFSEGYLTVAPTGYYGPATYNAVSRWQSRYGYYQNGVARRDEFRNYGSSYTSSNSRRSDADREDARDALNDATDAYEDALDRVDRSRNNTRSAEECLDEAYDALRDAEDAYDDRDYDEVIDRTQDAEDLIEDALDKLDRDSYYDYNDDYWYDDYSYNNDSDQVYAEDAIGDARNVLREAYKQVRYGYVTRNSRYAESLLYDAEDVLNDAQDAYDDRDYDEALDLAEESRDLIDEALDQF